MVVISGGVRGKESGSASERRAEESQEPGQEATIPAQQTAHGELAALGRPGSPWQQGLMGGKDSHL